MTDERKRISEILAELAKKIDQLIAESKRAGSKLSADLELRIKELKKEKEKLEEEWYSNGGNEKWEEAKTHLNNAANEVRRAFEVFIKQG